MAGFERFQKAPVAEHLKLPWLAEVSTQAVRSLFRIWRLSEWSLAVLGCYTNNYQWNRRHTTTIANYVIEFALIVTGP